MRRGGACCVHDATQSNLGLGDGKNDGNDGWQLGYWVSEAEGAGRGEKWWSTERSESAGSPKLMTF